MGLRPMPLKTAAFSAPGAAPYWLTPLCSSVPLCRHTPEQQQQDQPVHGRGTEGRNRQRGAGGHCHGQGRGAPSLRGEPHSTILNTVKHT